MTISSRGQLEGRRPEQQLSNSHSGQLSLQDVGSNVSLILQCTPAVLEQDVWGLGDYQNSFHGGKGRGRGQNQNIQGKKYSICSPGGIKHLPVWLSSADHNKNHQRHSPEWTFAAGRKTQQASAWRKLMVFFALEQVKLQFWLYS